MSIDVKWLLEGRVLFAKSQGEITVAQLQEMETVIPNLLAQAAAPSVHIIIDHTELTKQPSIFEQTKTKWPRNPKIGWVVIIGMPNHILKITSSVSAQVFNIRIRFVDTRDQAVALLHNVDSTLPDLKPLLEQG